MCGRDFLVLSAITGHLWPDQQRAVGSGVRGGGIGGERCSYRSYQVLLFAKNGESLPINQTAE